MFFKGGRAGDLRKSGSGRMHMHVDKTGTRHVAIMALGDSSTWLVCHALECDRCIQKNDDAVRDVMNEGRDAMQKGLDALLGGAGGPIDIGTLQGDIKKMAKRVNKKYDAKARLKVPRSRAGTGPKVNKADRESWFHPGRCSRCRPITLQSGDVLLFDGNPDAAVAHGVQNTLRDTAPRGLPAWCRGGRTSVQFRLTAVRRRGLAGMGGMMGGMGGGGGGGSAVRVMFVPR